MDNDPLLSRKELASALGRARNYVHVMERVGFIMPGGRATLKSALSFLSRNEPPWVSYRASKRIASNS